MPAAACRRNSGGYFNFLICCLICTRLHRFHDVTPRAIVTYRAMDKPRSYP